MAFMKVAITDHTTASLPRPHVVYYVDVLNADGVGTRVAKRYSDVSSHDASQYHTEYPDHSRSSLTCTMYWATRRRFRRSVS